MTQSKVANMSYNEGDNFTPKDTDIRKNTREVIRIEPHEYHGRKLINMRVYFELEEGGLRPTKKGIVFSRDLLPEVIDRLADVRADMEREAWPVRE